MRVLAPADGDGAVVFVCAVAAAMLVAQGFKLLKACFVVDFFFVCVVYAG